MLKARAALVTIAEQSEGLSADAKVLLAEVLASIGETERSATLYDEALAENPAHERAVVGALRARGLDVTCSHQVSPEMREYERTVTTVINAALRLERSGPTEVSMLRPVPEEDRLGETAAGRKRA